LVINKLVGLKEGSISDTKLKRPETVRQDQLRKMSRLRTYILDDGERRFELSSGPREKREGGGEYCRVSLFRVNRFFQLEILLLPRIDFFIKHKIEFKITQEPGLMSEKISYIPIKTSCFH
jgi:hypothetical protein